MLKKAFLIVSIVLLVVQAAGCLGGNPPTSKEALASLDATILKYEVARTPYLNGNYSDARDEYSACVGLFNGCHDTFDRIAAADRPSLEKMTAGRLASSAEKFAYASAYMRDSCKDALNSGGKVYLLKVSADEFELAACNIYRPCKADLERFLNSQQP